MTLRFTSLWCRYFEIFPSMNRQESKMNINFQKIAFLSASFLEVCELREILSPPSFKKKKKKSPVSFIYQKSSKQAKLKRPYRQTNTLAM